jgi:hypothetical protein
MQTPDIIYRPERWRSYQAKNAEREQVLTCSIDGERFTFPVFGEWATISQRALLQSDDDLLAGTPWHDQGYTIQPFLQDDLYVRLVEGLHEWLRTLIGHMEPNILKASECLPLVHYHRLTQTSATLHDALQARLIQGIPIRELPVPKTCIEERISEICGQDLSLKGPLPHEMFMVRLIRPGSNDHNMPHRDVWLDVFRNSVTIYVPIAGSNQRSALPLIPGSHIWTDAAVESFFAGKITAPMERVNPGANQVLVFSPYLIHGGAVNCNHDMTRVSLEMRFWRRPDFPRRATCPGGTDHWCI